VGGGFAQSDFIDDEEMDHEEKKVDDGRLSASTNFIEIGIKSSNSKINFNSHKIGKFFLL
jgi:hypothetical protein